MYNQIKSLVNSNNYKQAIKLLTEMIEAQDNAIIQQNDAINQLHKRLKQLENYNKLTQKVVEPILEESEPEVRSLNDMLQKSFESEQ